MDNSTGTSSTSSDDFRLLCRSWRNWNFMQELEELELHAETGGDNLEGNSSRKDELLSACRWSLLLVYRRSPQ
ncbi:hypothetical protein AVEN_117371-1 [Araneus ventricosus]|uniref:Uncharacterized protein n=1 Tax=Araneus ventricosus TaxID=182803 RepID=A0A4Y2E6G0_ARAVE|nr:hypothetical protein AVEN_117371-1 [Araneus ventricosus]